MTPPSDTHPSRTMGFPSMEKQWWRGEMYAFSCTVLRPCVRHTPVQYPHASFQEPASGNLGALHSQGEQHAVSASYGTPGNSCLIRGQPIEAHKNKHANPLECTWSKLSSFILWC